MDAVKSGISVKEIYDILYKRYGPQDWWPARTDFEVIVGAILTQNTAWTNVEKAIESLRRERLLSARALYDTSHAKLASLIRSAGYYNVKAKRLKHFLDFLFNEYGGDIRALKKVETKVLRNKLLGVNGIGPETCDSIMLYALEKPVFVVDAYTKRIFSRHGFLRTIHHTMRPRHILRSAFQKTSPPSMNITR